MKYFKFLIGMDLDKTVSLTEELESNFNFNLVALVDGVPQTLSLNKEKKENGNRSQKGIRHNLLQQVA